jgi:hypothetical protein
VAGALILIKDIRGMRSDQPELVLMSGYPNVGQIDRGYERIDERLGALGANLERTG